MTAVQQSARVAVEEHEATPLTDGWELAASTPDACADAAASARLAWQPAEVPGTAAGALQRAGSWQAGQPRDFDCEDWWFRTRFAAEPPADGEQLVLALDGLATIAEVYLNGERVLDCESMFASHAVEVTARLRPVNELAICCRALQPRLAVRRRPRARWRTRLAKDGNLRFFRTMLLGRAPGAAPGPAAVGPWRPVRLERRRRAVVESIRLRPSVRDGAGCLSLRANLRALDGFDPGRAQLTLHGPTGSHSAELSLQRAPAGGAIAVQGTLEVAEAARWWPHTHGTPSLYEVCLLLGSGDRELRVRAGRVGFRELSFGAADALSVGELGLDLHVNGVRVFARGAVWTPPDAVSLHCDAQLRGALERVRDAGMNMLRIPGTSAYETGAFHDLCDELGILIWQDLMFANLDYPFADERFAGHVEAEVAELLERLGGRASLAVLCGNSEIEQQVAMLGLDPGLGRGEFFGELLPRRISDAGVDAAYVSSAPTGGALPFRPGQGIANYYGVGGYRRALSDARAAEVRFAAECLAFSNVPDPETVALMLPLRAGGPVVHDPAWKTGVPRDVGTGWDFEDVRDHYLRELYDLDPGELRRTDHERYLELSRAVTGEVMAEVFGEWRRAGSPCGGGLVLWLNDLLPGAGWGLVDHRGAAKVALHHLRRALAPVAVWTTDEGLAGVAVHVANDRPRPLRATLRVALYADLERRVGEAVAPLELAAHGSCSLDAETLLGRFVDASFAYRFGPPAQDAIFVSLESAGEDGAPARTLSQAVRFPAGRPTRGESPERLGLSATIEAEGASSASVRLHSRRLAWGVRLAVPGFRATDDAFTLEPGRARTIEVRRASPHAQPGGTVTALNMLGRVAIASPSQAGAREPAT